jgi:RNA polymerase sigma-70 factor (ECF subfamily)
MTMLKQTWNKGTENEVGKGKDELFERTVLPYLKSAYNLARWLTRNEHDAEDVVQEAYLRALRSFGGFLPGRDARAWLLMIVRNTSCTWLRQNRPAELSMPFDEGSEAAVSKYPDPEAVLIQKSNSQVVQQALEKLALEYREVIVLRELEGLSYKEIAQIVEIPLGTVMSRLSRARRELYVRLGGAVGEKKR